MLTMAVIWNDSKLGHVLSNSTSLRFIPAENPLEAIIITISLVPSFFSTTALSLSTLIDSLNPCPLKRNNSSEGLDNMKAKG